MKIARFRNIEPGCLNGYETIQNAEFGGGTYVRISEVVEVEFPPLKDDEVIQDHLRALDAAEREVRNDMQRKLDDIKTARANLMALTYTPAASARRDPDEAFDGGRLG